MRVQRLLAVANARAEIERLLSPPPQGPEPVGTHP